MDKRDPKDRYSDSPKLTVGLLGGSFNPPHEGHVFISEYAKKQLGLAQIWWLVTPQNPLKSADILRPLEERMEQAKALTDTIPYLYVSDIEKELESHYSCNVITHLQQRFTTYQFIWLMGADNALQFHRWKNYDHIVNHIAIGILNRDEGRHHMMSSHLLQQYKDHIVSPSQLLASPLPAISILDNPLHPASSTAIRKKK